jgi:hypothetical protein
MPVHLFRPTTGRNCHECSRDICRWQGGVRHRLRTLPASLELLDTSLGRLYNLVPAPRPVKYWRNRVESDPPTCEQGFSDWVRRFILFHGKRHPAVLSEQ